MDRLEGRVSSRAAPAGLREAAILAMTAVILLLGGAGNSYPLLGALVETAAFAIIVLVGWIALSKETPAKKLPKTAIFLIGANFLVPLLQLLPLPPPIWTALPGRALAVSVLTAAGLPLGWRGVSLDPTRTLATSLEMLPGIALFLAVLQGTRRRSNSLVAVVLMVAVMSTVMAAFQRLSAGSWAFPYEDASTNSPGLFVNRNHQASYLLVAIPLCAAWLSSTPLLAKADRSFRALIAWGTVAIFLAAIVLTTSRAGIVLAPLAVLSTAAILHGRRASRTSVTLTVACLAATAAAATQFGAVRQALDRFSQQADSRTEFSATTIQTAFNYLPFGSGLGTFQLVYPIGEPREAIQAYYVNDAHNDYAQILLEGGILPLAAIIALISILYHSISEIARGRNQARNSSTSIAAATGVLVLGLHSFVDYPLRMMTLMAVGGLLLAILIVERDGFAAPGGVMAIEKGRGPTIPLRFWWIATATASVLSLAPIWMLALSQARLDLADAAGAVAVNPRSSDALIASARQALAKDDYLGARSFGARALATSPLNAAAAGLMIQADINSGETARAQLLLGAARGLGWREPLLQYALMREAAKQKDFPQAAVHADALLRSDTSSAVPLTFLRKLEGIPRGNAALVKLLALKPGWRTNFLTDLHELDPRDSDAHARLLTDLASTSAPAESTEVNSFTQYLLSHGQTVKAGGIAARFHRSSGIPSIPEITASVDLNKATDSNDPFAWHAGDALGVTVRQNLNGAIAIKSSGATAGTVLYRRSILGAGDYLLTGIINGSFYDKAKLIGLSFTCTGAANSPPTSTDYRFGGGNILYFSKIFRVPSSGCDEQRLSIFINYQTSPEVELEINRLKITQSF